MTATNLLKSLVVGTLLAVSSACTVISDFDECSTDADCSSGTCNTGVCEGAASCATTNDCGDGRACVWGACHAIDTERCTLDEKLEPSPDQTTLHIGLLLPYSGRNATKADATGKAAQTAMLQINGTHDGVRKVHLSAIRCDTEQNAAKATEVAEYLVNTLGVQSVIGSISSSETLAVVDVTKPARVVLVSPASTSPTISTLDDDDLVWRTIASDALQGPALANIVANAGHEEVLLLVLDDAYGQGLFTSFIAAKGDGVNVEAINYEVDDGGDLVADALVESVTAKLGDGTYKPDAIIVMGSLESQQLIFAIDDNFFGDLAEAEKPSWILSEAGRDVGLLDAQYSGVWSRLSGTIVQTLETPVYEDFELRLSTNYQIEASEHQFADKAYDAAWLLALAHGAADQPLATTGADVAASLAKTQRAEAFSPGEDLATALNRLAGDGLDYAGASGPVDFDPTTGDVQSEISLWVINTDAAPKFETTQVVFSPE